VRLANGKVLEAREESQRGGPDKPIAPDEVVQKFRDNAARLMPGSQAAELESAVLGMERAPDLLGLLALCRVG
jgi:hypothetical protein